MSNIIVTGAAGALGRAVVSLFVERGHRVAAIDLAADPKNSTAEMVEGGIDLTDETAVKDCFARVAERFGGIDALVNVAGGFVWELVDSGSFESWDRMQKMNVRTALVSSKAVLPYLASAQAGSIVNIGAAGAVRPGAGMAPYAASKAGVNALTESLAEELRDKGIRVNSVMPTIIDTPTNRADMPDADTSAWVKPETLAKVIAFLISDDAAGITGVGIPVSLRG